MGLPLPGTRLNATSPGTLHVVATPIGNLGDFSPRAAETLKSVAAICAEDTRRTRPLLQQFGIDTPLVALHDHNEDEIAARLVARLLSGESLALVSDAGTPLISDPGYRLVRAAREAGVRVSPVPGPAALIAALVLGLLNAIVRPLLVLLTLPVTLMTLGLFLFVINALMFWAAAGMLQGLHVAGFGAALIGSLIYSACSVVIDIALERVFS